MQQWPAEEGWIKVQQTVEVYEPVKSELGKKYPKPPEKYKIVIHYQDLRKNVI